MSIEENKAVVRRLYDEVFNQGKLDTLEEISAANYVEHYPFPGQGNGREDLRKRVELLSRALTPQFTVEDLIAEGDKVVVRWTNRGTHVDEFLGIPATFRSFAVPGVDIYRMKDGKMAEHWHVVDQLGQLQQLGLIPGAERVEANVDAN